ncbi:MAG: hypothetical protein J6I40_01330 [Mailhella sp.]|nr:hypothetical protein [Mailhella sp.]
METMLIKIARQLNAMDEASLMAYWDKYMAKVQYFDGSKEWEEATLILALIQAVRGKNQLFNAHMQERRNRPGASPREHPAQKEKAPANDKETQERQPRKILQFRPLKAMQP